MSLHDSDAMILEASGPAESLPDPTLFSGRTHQLHNNTSANQVWSSVGATPFTVDGVNVATLTLQPGQSRLVYSNGTRWVALATAVRRVFAATAVSDGAGNAVFTFTPPFASTPVVSTAVQTGNTNVTEARVTALSAASCTVNIRSSAGINVALLGLTLLGLPVPLAGATVHLHAIEPGQGV
jgi:hypothetical protein